MTNFVTWFLEYFIFGAWSLGGIDSDMITNVGGYGMVLKVMSLTSCWTDDIVAGISERYSEKFLKGFRTPENFRVVLEWLLRDPGRI